MDKTCLVLFTDSRQITQDVRQDLTGRIACRLIAAAYSEEDTLLGTAMSLPINVLANNDAPHGPATIEMNLPLAAIWSGWDMQESAAVDLEISPEGRQYSRMHANSSMQLSDAGTLFFPFRKPCKSNVVIDMW